ncbi:MAG: ATP-binding protein, partial [Acidobacteriota bacterium]
SLLQTEEELGDGLALPLDEVEKALVRARALSDQLLTFASGGVPRNRPVDLADLVNRSISMVFRDDAGLFELEVPEDLPHVDVDPEQIGQVLNNLLLEARQEAGDGKVRISARPEKVGGIRGTKLAPGSYVRLEIFDGGAGLSGEEIARIFEPYVASRRSGTGMALATSQAIVKRHRGAIEVSSEVGTGTTFSILLRTAKGARKKQPKAAAPARRPSSGRGRVLIMDDESSILTLLSAALKRLGFETVATTDGRSALEACQAARDEDSPFHVAILDLTIPGGMGGIEAAAGLRDLQSDLLLVASSGYSQNPALVEPRRHGFDEALVKPYRIPDLAKLFDRMLGSPSS